MAGMMGSAGRQCWQYQHTLRIPRVTQVSYPLSHEGGGKVKTYNRASPVRMFRTAPTILSILGNPLAVRLGASADRNPFNP